MNEDKTLTCVGGIVVGDQYELFACKCQTVTHVVLPFFFNHFFPLSLAD